MIASGQNRTLNYAVALSMALHALVLFSFQNPPDPARRGAHFPPPLLARLVEPEPAPAPATKSVAPRVSKPALAPTPPTPAPLVAAPQIQAPSSPAASAVEPEPPLASIEPRAPSAPSTAEAPESLSRDQYRLELIDEARRHKRYPPLARENNWQGDVRVAVVIGANGRASVTLNASSGYEVLDRQALDMFSQATRAVAVPPALRGKEFALEVRALYGLED